MQEEPRGTFIPRIAGERVDLRLSQSHWLGVLSYGSYPGGAQDLGLSGPALAPPGSLIFAAHRTESSKPRWLD